MRIRESTQYWNLATGSRIGYTLIKGQEPKQKTPIIYLHGGPGGPIYDNNIISLTPLTKDGYDIYLYDQIGCGHSDRLSDIREYSAIRHKIDLEEIIKTIGSEKVILIGQSWGAMLANLYIADNPEKVEKAIFTGPGPVLPIRKGLAYLEAPDSLNLRQPFFTNKQANEKVHNIRSKAMTKWALLFDDKLASDKEADDFATLLNLELSKSTFADTLIKMKPEGGTGFYSHIMTIKSFSEIKDQRTEIYQLKIPVLIMKGQYDNQKWGFTREYLELYPNHKLVVIPNAGHSIAAEQGDLYIKTIRGFLNP